jgi:hypothetical protein
MLPLMESVGTTLLNVAVTVVFVLADSAQTFVDAEEQLVQDENTAPAAGVAVRVGPVPFS